MGKTTLLKIILGELSAHEGQVEIGEKTLINYVDQSRVALNDEEDCCAGNRRRAGLASFRRRTPDGVEIPAAVPL